MPKTTDSTGPVPEPHLPGPQEDANNDADDADRDRERETDK